MDRTMSNLPFASHLTTLAEWKGSLLTEVSQLPTLFDSTNCGFSPLTKLLLANGKNVSFSLSQGKDSLWNPRDNNIMVLNSMVHLVITSDDDCEIIQLASCSHSTLCLIVFYFVLIRERSEFNVPLCFSLPTFISTQSVTTMPPPR